MEHETSNHNCVIVFKCMLDKKTEIADRINEILRLAGEGQVNLASQDARDKLVSSIIDVVDPVCDELESVWLMLDEMRASDIKNFEEALDGDHKFKEIGIFTAEKIDETEVRRLWPSCRCGCPSWN